jgi:hypothetical protein
MPGSRGFWSLVAALTVLGVLGAAPTKSAALQGTPPPDESSQDLYGWLALDLDRWGPQLSLGASHAIAGPLALAANVWMNLEAGTQHAIGEFDLGPELMIGDAVRLTLQFGLGFDFSANELLYLSVPLFLVVDLDRLYFEAWNFVFFYDALHDRDDSPVASVAPPDSYAGRYALLYKLLPAVALGPQVELAVNFHNAGVNELETVSSVPIGARIDVGYGSSAKFGAFLAYETRAGANTHDGRLVGRLSYSHVFF